MNQQQQSLGELLIQAQRRQFSNTSTWACTKCPERKIFISSDELWKHATADHKDQMPSGDSEREAYRTKFEAACLQKRTTKESPIPRKPHARDEPPNTHPEPLSVQGKRPLNTTPAPFASSRTSWGLQELNINTPRSDNVTMLHDASDDDQPRKRAAIGDGISAGSVSPYREASASPPPPTRSRARATPPDTFEAQRPHVERKQLWTEQDRPLARSSFQDTSNIASIQTQKNRAQALQPKNRKSFPSAQQPTTTRLLQNSQPIPTPILRNPLAKDENYDIILQPETRPISQEQLVAEVKGIYAGLVMVEAKCIEVDNKQATLAAADPGAQPKLNNEQWQALIALHRTLLHEHHDFFLASQHPSASPALRRLASKYAMPARMWRHGIHSFLELLRHRLPASLDHMLAFIYLAYSMMALLYETVPAFEDTWIECLGDLGRYRMAIEDDDIRDREVWTGVARHWYSKASDKAPTTGRLYHHLAILARPNALQQLFYYSKSLCVFIPFASARESILTLFEPVLNTDNSQGQYRLPPLDTAFVKAHGLLFTNRDMDKFEPTVKEFLGLLDNQIGRVTRKFMEQGYYIAVANAVAILGFASKENPLMKAMALATLDATGESDIQMAGTTSDEAALAIKSFEHAQCLSNSTLEIVLQRIGDPNVLPFIHVTLVFMFYMARHPGAMRLLETKFPWQALAVMLNTLLVPYGTPARIQNTEFPLPEKDDVRPFTEDFAMRGLLWADKYYPENWFSNDKIDDEEKYLEVASMTDDRRERILWLAARLTKLGPWMYFNGNKFSVTPLEPIPTVEAPVQVQCLSPEPADPQSPLSRSYTYASATTIGRSATWASEDAGNASEEDDYGPPKSVGDPGGSPRRP